MAKEQVRATQAEEQLAGAQQAAEAAQQALRSLQGRHQAAAERLAGLEQQGQAAAQQLREAQGALEAERAAVAAGRQEMAVLRAGAGQAQEEALAHLKVSFPACNAAQWRMMCMVPLQQ